jgi:hypothetical protein
MMFLKQCIIGKNCNFVKTIQTILACKVKENFFCQAHPLKISVYATVLNLPSSFDTSRASASSVSRLDDDWRTFNDDTSRLFLNSASSLFLDPVVSVDRQ